MSFILWESLYWLNQYRVSKAWENYLVSSHFNDEITYKLEDTYHN